MDLEVHEVILVEELEHDLHHLEGRDQPLELYKACAWANEIADNRVAKVERQSRQLVQVAGVLINLGLPPIEDIPQLPKIVWDTLVAVALILEHLQGALDSGTGLWN
jgi:hypothetical protein